MFTTTDGCSFVSMTMGFTFVLCSASLVYGLSRVTLNVPLSNVSLCGTLNYRGENDGLTVLSYSVLTKLYMLLVQDCCWALL